MVVTGRDIGVPIHPVFNTMLCVGGGASAGVGSGFQVYGRLIQF